MHVIVLNIYYKYIYISLYLSNIVTMIFLEHVLIFLLIRTEMMDKPKTCLQFTYIMTIFL